ncbi:MAG TPA: hypothetical protein PKN33_16900 [Phycisphaerae bacterium]|nr:hypothetical protein [Phycisphaerae bacterium]
MQKQTSAGLLVLVGIMGAGAAITSQQCSASDDKDQHSIVGKLIEARRVVARKKSADIQLVLLDNAASLLEKLADRRTGEWREFRGSTNDSGPAPVAVLPPLAPDSVTSMFDGGPDSSHLFGMTDIRFSGFRVAIEHTPLRIRDEELSVLDHVAKDSRVPTETAAEVRKRIASMTELDFLLASFQLAPINDASVKDKSVHDALYELVLASGKEKLGQARHCYYAKHGRRAVLCYMDPGQCEAGYLITVVFEDKQPLYEIDVYIRGSKLNSPTNEECEIAETIARSAIEYALNPSLRRKEDSGN